MAAAHAIAALVVSVTLAGCASAPPAGTPEHAAWVKQKQAEGAANQQAGCLCGSLDNFPLPAR
jgi:hypothetical protein